MRVRRAARKIGGVTGQGGRGALLEDLVNFTNEQYRRRGIALVQKIPTPITPISMQGAMITKAFFTEKSTVDYIGIMEGGRGVAFDAKECHTDTFPLKNVHRHQVEFLKEFHEYGGAAFLLIYYSEHQKFYMMPYEDLAAFIDRMEAGGRKSVAWDDLTDSHFLSEGIQTFAVPYIEWIKEAKV